MKNILERKEESNSSGVCVTKFILASNPSWDCFQSNRWTGLDLKPFSLSGMELWLQQAGFLKSFTSLMNTQFLSILTQCDVYFLCQFYHTLTCGAALNNSTPVWSVAATSYPLTDHVGCPLYPEKENSEEAFPNVHLHLSFFIQNIGSKFMGSSTFWEIPCVDLDKCFSALCLMI